MFAPFDATADGTSRLISISGMTYLNQNFYVRLKKSTAFKFHLFQL